MADTGQLPAVVDALRAEVARLRAQLEARRDPDRFVTPKEAAHAAGVSPGAVYMKISRGQLARHPIAKTRRYLVRLGDVLGGVR